MYATQKYNASDRLATSRAFARDYPDRVPIILSSPHWSFYSFRCMLAPLDITVRELSQIVLSNWTSKFPKHTTHVLLKVVPESVDKRRELDSSLEFDFQHDPLPNSTPLRLVNKHAIGADGFLWLSAHIMT